MGLMHAAWLLALRWPVFFLGPFGPLSVLARGIHPSGLLCFQSVFTFQQVEKPAKDGAYISQIQSLFFLHAVESLRMELDSL